jgi:glucose-6-phosphate isomerase
MTNMPKTEIDIASWAFKGEGVTESRRVLGDLKGVFADEAARAAMDQGQTVYEVQMHAAVPEGTPCGLFLGVSCLRPGDVAGEYFMTKGHFHARRETAEYYWGVAGEGALILMDENGECRWERVFPGSVHYIPGNVAHRLANTGTETLRVGACWPSDAGHDYATIAASGFTKRLFKGANGPELR